MYDMILHQSETTNGWRILRSGPLFIKESKTINATIFLNRLDKCLETYCDKLRTYAKINSHFSLG
jgi:hypothetical protein